MPATLMDDTRPIVSTPMSPPPSEASLVPGPVVRRGPSRRRRRVAGRLGRLAALLAMFAWVVVGLMPVAAVLLAVYGS